MDKGYFSDCVNICCGVRKEKKTPRGMLPFSPRAVIFSVDGSASMPSWSTSQKWKVISSICGHSTLRGSLVTVQKNFIYFQACSCLSEPPGVEWRRGGWGGLHSLCAAGNWQPPAMLFLGIPELFWSAYCPSGSWTAAFPATLWFAVHHIFVFC